MPADRTGRPKPARSAKSLKRQEKRDLRRRTAALYAPRRLSTTGRWTVAAILAGTVVALLLAAATSGTQIAWAGSWVGGPTGFTVTVGMMAGLSLPLVCSAILAGEHPHRVPPRLRCGRPVRIGVVGLGTAGAVAGAVLLIVARAPGKGLDPAACTDLGCWLAVHEPRAAPWGVVTAGTTLVLGVIALSLWLSDDDPRERRRNAGHTAVAAVGVGVFIAAMALPHTFSAELYALAEHWPGGAPVFLLCAGVGAPAGCAAAALALRKGSVLPRWFARVWATIPLAIGLTAGGILVSAVRPRRYKGPVLCEEDFYCLLDQAHGQATMHVWFGFLAAAVTGGLLLTILWRRARRQAAHHGYTGTAVATTVHSDR
ncbi:hypothetical protein ACFV5N_05460 [Streptomyces sp. NPDC059853]|uniref:hypothetical protein n=1 Tax=Streptomyces sp. NPDC059853 TaxID=3346973 RepID=UPI003646622B